MLEGSLLGHYLATRYYANYVNTLTEGRQRSRTVDCATRNELTFSVVNLSFCVLGSDVEGTVGHSDVGSSSVFGSFDARRTGLIRFFTQLDLCCGYDDTALLVEEQGCEVQVLGVDFGRCAFGHVELEFHFNGFTQFSGGQQSITCGDTGLIAPSEKSGQGSLLLSGGNTAIVSGGDGIRAAGTLSTSGGSYHITTGGGSSNRSYGEDAEKWGLWGGLQQEQPPEQEIGRASCRERV